MDAATNTSCLRAGDLELRPAECTAIAGDRLLTLTAREFELLTALVEREGRVVSREELHRSVWGEHYHKSDRSVDVYVARLRHKLRHALPGMRFIHTRFGFGYRFEAQPCERALGRLR